jgi:hypothetical protein
MKIFLDMAWVLLLVDEFRAAKIFFVSKNIEVTSESRRVKIARNGKTRIMNFDDAVQTGVVDFE